MDFPSFTRSFLNFFLFHLLSLYLLHSIDPLSAEEYDTKLHRGGSIDNVQEGLDYGPRSRSSSQSHVLTGGANSPFRTPLRISTSTADRGKSVVFMRNVRFLSVGVRESGLTFPILILDYFYWFYIAQSHGFFFDFIHLSSMAYPIPKGRFFEATIRATESTS